MPCKFKLMLLVLSLSVCAAAQAERAVIVREAILYLQPDSTSTKLGHVTRGRELVYIERSGGYVKVLATTSGTLEVTGWIVDKGIIRKNTPNGDAILYGEASESEAEATRPHGRLGAAQDAARLYYHTAEYFPNSPLAGEALWRAADIRWQLEREDTNQRPSAKSSDIDLKPEIDEQYMNEVRKKFPNSKWSDMADYDKLDNRFCGDWRGLPKCPEKESDQLEKYVKDHPTSPKNAEALYEAARRQTALVELYRGLNEPAKSAAARTHAQQLCQQVIAQYAQSGDWA